ncbi:MAG: type II toxin-antitoxin system prevent-host-death family antitoxin [Lentisphaerae bacterium]|nr:type II toxin-antitoxin system prevent-host-death family antitoxin [Lentisphaerota bacterium]
MKAVNVAELRAHFGEYLAEVERGEDVQICKRNKSVARLVRISTETVKNETRLGSAQGTVSILGDIVSPAIEAGDWEMHG